MVGIEGFVAKFGGEGDSGWSKAVKREIRLGRETEQLADELSLADRIPLISHLTRPFRIMSTVSMPCNVRHAL